jgi:hypothetical protein
MVPENITAVITRNECWKGVAATEPYEAGWAREAVFFVRALKQPAGAAGTAYVEISPDGMLWIAEGTTFDLPTQRDGVSAVRIANFGNWLRIRAEFPDAAECTVLVTLHLKA